LAAKYAAHELATRDYETQRLTNEMRLRGFDMEAKWVKKSVTDRTERKVADDAEADNWRYKQSAAETDLQYATKRHMISLKDADLARIVLQDRTAAEAFEAVRVEKANDAQKELVKHVQAEIDAKERLRGTEMYNAGQFSTKYSAGYVNFAALNQSRPYGSLKDRGSFATGQAGQTFLPNTFSRRWPEETPGAGKSGQQTVKSSGPSEADVARAKQDAEIIHSATGSRLKSDKAFARMYEAAKSRMNYDAQVLRESETQSSAVQPATPTPTPAGSNSVVAELKEVCRILERIATNGGLN
jgi:hypothetical protein